MKATGWRSLGALAGTAGGIALGFGITEGFKANVGLGFLALGALIVVCVILYLVARKLNTAGPKVSEAMPGALLGLNLGVNAVLLGVIISPIAIVICLIPALAVIQPVAQSDIYQAFLGWSNLLLPMSWLIVGLGLLFLIFSGILALINLAIKSTFLKIEHFDVDWKTGTAFLVGGLAGNGNLAKGSTGYNMGNFAFLKKGNATSTHLIEHEAGHTLNLGIWGAVVHLIGALDENVFGGGANAYTELFAESNVPPSGRTGSIFPMWGPPVGTPVTAPAPAVPAGT